jgi:tRNA nucleotidyltransferase/poly(A) polymerase
MMAAPYAGKGLSMMMDTGILKVILGEDAVARLSRREMSDLTLLCQNVDKTQQVPERRLGLLFTCVDKKKAMPAIEKLQFDEQMRIHLVDAVKDMAKLYFIAQKPDLKKFIYAKGWERYNYMASLEKAQRIVFDFFNETKIKSKIYLIEEIKMYRETIFEDELAIDANDLLAAGICKDAEDAAKMLTMLVEEMHVHPRKNTRTDLLELAKKYKKFKFLTWTRGTHWLH